MRLWLLLALAIWLVPSTLHAQDMQEPQAQEQDPEPYEPDQRGEHEEADDLYEPDQRGEIETGHYAAPDFEAEPADAPRPSAGVADARAGTSFALQLRLGPTLTPLDIGGDQGGIGFGVGLFAGVDLGALTLGPAFGFTLDRDFTLGTAAFEAQLSLGGGPLDPYLRAALGYTFITGLGDTRSAFHAELGAGLAFRITPSLALTTDVSAAALIPHGYQLRLTLGLTLAF